MKPLAGKGLSPRNCRAASGLILDVALVQPERKLINVAAKMFLAGVVIDADQAAFEAAKTNSIPLVVTSSRTYRPRYD